MKKRNVLFGLAVCAAATVLADKPNIVVILSDDSGYSDLGCYGGEIDTPNIDRLAEQGMRLSNFYNNGRCSPTRATLMSGLECAKVGFGAGSLGDWCREMPYPAHRGRLPYNIPILPELMKEAGYHTMMSGKWHLGGSLMKDSKNQQKLWQKEHVGWDLTEEEMSEDFNGLPSQRGFDEYFGIYGAQNNFFFLPKEGHPYMEGNKPAALKYDRNYTLHCYSKKPGEGYGRDHGKSGNVFYATDGVTDRAIEMIDGASGQKDPFFLYVAYRAPHKPLQAPEKLVQKYLPRYQNPEEVERKRVEGVKAQGFLPEDQTYVKSYIPPDREDFIRQCAIHAAMIDSMDQNVGRVIDALKANGVLDNTLILYFSDNGSAAHLNGLMNAPYHGVKALLWEGGTKAHCIAVWPGKIQPKSVSHELVWVGDIVPTLLNVAGGQYPETFRGKKLEPLDGQNVMPVFAGQKVAPPETLFFNDKGQQSVIYQGRWKLLVEPGWYLQTRDVPGTAYELYDLKNDPTEMNNLAGSNPEMVQSLAKKCEAWIKKSGIVDYGELIKLRPNDPF